MHIQKPKQREVGSTKPKLVNTTGTRAPGRRVANAAHPFGTQSGNGTLRGSIAAYALGCYGKVRNNVLE